jgi:hypothetical protein
VVSSCCGAASCFLGRGGGWLGHCTHDESDGVPMYADSGLCDCLSCRHMCGMSVMRQQVCLGSGWWLLYCWAQSQMH